MIPIIKKKIDLLSKKRSKRPCVDCYIENKKNSVMILSLFMNCFQTEKYKYEIRL